MRKRSKRTEKTPSQRYVEMICRLYGDVYDDREEDSRIKGMDWTPGMKARHKSLGAFQAELEQVHGIHLSRSKLQKILITGNCWKTERSREVQQLYKAYTSADGKNGKRLEPEAAVRAIAEELNVSTVCVTINLPYQKVVYDLDDKSANAMRIEKCRLKKE